MNCFRNAIPNCVDANGDKLYFLNSGHQEAILKNLGKFGTAF